MHQSRIRRAVIADAVEIAAVGPSRHDDGNLLPAVFAIDLEMRVKREDAGGGMQFG
jgi:hypothetical protein